MKTPREEALELVELHLKVLCSNTAEYELEFFKSRAIKCALITVDAILNYDIKAKSEPQFVIERRIQEHYQEVKTELEKLS